mmetsp:Transcript_19399/g.56750  ORF Transcript_19399/g.56750 Transcript_19399/m.56750 type:complete len:258 (-) Transcript_19399:3397-4170(-)
MTSPFFFPGTLFHRSRGRGGTFASQLPNPPFPDNDESGYHIDNFNGNFPSAAYLRREGAATMERRFALRVADFPTRSIETMLPEPSWPPLTSTPTWLLWLLLCWRSDLTTSLDRPFISHRRSGSPPPLSTSTSSPPAEEEEDFFFFCVFFAPFFAFTPFFALKPPAAGADADAEGEVMSTEGGGTSNPSVPSPSSPSSEISVHSINFVSVSYVFSTNAFSGIQSINSAISVSPSSLYDGVGENTAVSKPERITSGRM